MKQLIACLFAFALVVCSRHVAFASPDNDVGVKEKSVFSIQKSQTAFENDLMIFNYCKVDETIFDQNEDAIVIEESQKTETITSNPGYTGMYVTAWKQTNSCYILPNYAPITVNHLAPDVITVTSLYSCRLNK